jgi:DNA polymerase
MQTLRLSGDFETASQADLSRVGAYNYARHPSTRILCFAWAIGAEEPEVWFSEWDKKPPRRLIDAVQSGAELHAWNAAFEFCVWNFVGTKLWGLPRLPIDRFHCSMARALYWGIPPKLETAAAVLDLATRKDAEGARLMKLMMSPRVTRTGEVRWWDRDEPDRLERLGAYCQQDVRTERAVASKLKALPAAERVVWLLDQKMNMHGLTVDLDAVDAMQRVVDDEVRRIGAALSEATGGAVTLPTQAARLLKWLKADGVTIDSLAKSQLPAVLDDLEKPLTGLQRRVIGLYQEGAKTSTGKLKAMREHADQDGRVRYLVQYGGALRTLRWAGRGVQIQNYPRPTKDYDTKLALNFILDQASAEDLAVVAPPMDMVSQCLRGCYVPGPGRAFAVVDYSAIEARVVAWLAGQVNILDAFVRGDDVYSLTAREVGSNSRTLGKVLVLACGFGMGWRRFRATAALHGVALEDFEAEHAVGAWRDLNAMTRSLWYDVDRAVRMVITERVADRWTHVGKIAFRFGKDRGPFHNAMLMRLPSGRSIVYRDARVDTIIVDEDGLGDPEDVIRYDGLDFSKKWSRIRTWGGKLVENATQATARDLLADAMVRLDNGADDLAVTIHDELIAEPLAERADQRLAEMKIAMGRPPDWARGLPLKAEGAVMTRYGKT